MKQTSPLIIGLVGLPGAGKTTIAEYLKKKGFYTITLSDFVRQEATNRKHHVIDRRLLQSIGNSMREKRGSEILARLAWDEIRKRNVKKAVIDGIRSISEVAFLEKQERFYLLGIDAEVKTRYERMKQMSDNKSVGTFGDFVKIEKRENGFGSHDAGLRVVDCMKRAYLIVANDANTKKLFTHIDNFLAAVAERKKHILNLIVLGPPGAGKTTQCRMLSERLHLTWLSMGEILREAYKKGLPEGIEWWEKFGKKGLNAPIDLKFGLLVKRMINAKNGFILDDFPRTKDDLAALKNYVQWSKTTIDKVVLVDVSEKTSLKRVMKRWHTGKKKGIERYDDSPYVLKVRIKEGYKKDLPTILHYFRAKKLLVTIDGNGRKSVGDIHKQIVQAVLK